MTKEEIKFQCLRVAMDNQPNTATSGIQGKEKKDIDGIIVDAQKVYDWVKKE